MEEFVPVEVILGAAKVFKKELGNSRKANYHDYERYKNLLHENGHYGYEKQLADILEV